MNSQIKRSGGRIVSRGIEWTDYTSNIVGGCFAKCQWRMPDGDIARCYAKDVALTFPNVYTKGFEHIYWRPEERDAWRAKQQPSRIFMDSMSDFLGAEVDMEKIEFGLEGMGEASKQCFQLLTKNPGRYRQLEGRIPENVWCGASTPPDFIRGKELSREQQKTMLQRTIGFLARFAQTHVTFLSIEPLSWDLAEVLEVALRGVSLGWAIIGAASNGRTVYEVDPEHLSNVLEVLDRRQVPVFFKGNLWGNALAGGGRTSEGHWREFFPNFQASPFFGCRLGSKAVPAYEDGGTTLVPDDSQWL